MILFQIELERLNTATDDINKLEVDLDVSIFLFWKHDLAFAEIFWLSRFYIAISDDDS